MNTNHLFKTPAATKPALPTLAAAKVEAPALPPRDDGSAEFQQLATDLRALLETDVDAGPGFIAFEIGGIHTVVAHGEAWGPENVSITCDFGALPEERRADVLLAALVANADMHSEFAPAFAVEPDSDHLVLMLVLPMDGLPADALMPTLVNISATAQLWQKTHFLDDLEDLDD